MKTGFLFSAVVLLVSTGYAQDKNAKIKQKTDSIDHRLKEVVVTGQYGPQSLRNSVYQTRIISAEQIRLRAATNVQQILSTELGFRFSNDMVTGTSNVSLMGVAGRGVKILLDGVAMVDRSDTRESLNQIDINSIERIEIVEGPLSVSYGSDALAGVINIITKRPGKEMLSLNARVQEETVGNSYSPFTGDGVHTQNVGGMWQNKGFSATAGLTHNDFSGFNVPGALATSTEIDSETNRWKPKEQWMGNTKLGYSKNNFNIWYRLDYVYETILAKGAYNPNNFLGSKVEYQTNRYTQQLQSDYRFNDRLQLNGVVALSNLKRATVTNVHDYSTGLEFLSDARGTQDIDKFRSINLRSTLQYKMSEQVSFQPGFDVNLDHSVGGRIEGDPSINDYAFFISSEIKLFNNSLLVRPGLRFINNSAYDAPPVIPSLNTKLRLNDILDLRVGYANGFRSPALRELYYNFVDANHKIFGNPDLKAEQSNSFNASLNLTDVTSGEVHFRSVLSGFYNDFENLIDYGQSSTDATATTLVNIYKSKTRGGTWENSIFTNNFQVSLGFSMVGIYNKFSESQATYGESSELVWSPEMNSNISYAFNKIGLTANLAYKFTGKKPVYQLTAATATTPEEVSLAKTGSFSIADLMLTKKIFKSLTLNAGVRNLLDVKKISNTAVNTGTAHSTSGPVPTNYGRSYVVGLSYNWLKN